MHAICMLGWGFARENFSCAPETEKSIQSSIGMRKLYVDDPANWDLKITPAQLSAQKANSSRSSSEALPESVWLSGS